CATLIVENIAEYFEFW
nr:immunoglobulin heavy chain junction region [Macaca mulatta]MOY19666.1 immunoglobulin heavy chain junction region [Macaca mulatta]MOY19888.1 immunoglobulin heavy chain junction region [Macaca mulatta]MOY20497.1 immunoglobulin heavy chain junction region [Macaca mulatta]MOY20838.1 immunoglobulin heavy chain junction region [Macaca mulatta]